jgi:phage portal protein BeeE
MDIIDQYNLAAEEYALGYGVTNPHIISIISSVMMTRDKRGIRGGGFVQSVVNNDLYGAISKADTQCYQNLKVIVSANQHSFLD